MDFAMLDKLIATRTLPYGHTRPRDQLYELFETLAGLRELRTKVTIAEIPEIDRQINFYARILED